VLGPVRDLDVLLERLREDAADLDDDERSAAARLISGLEVERAQARQELLTALDSDRYTDLVSSLAEAVRAPLPTSESSMEGQARLHDLVLAQFLKLRKAVKKAGENPSDTELHALRIHGKRLRYTTELAGTMFGKQMKKLVDVTKQFQDVLGEHQDAYVADERVRGLLRDLGDQVDAGVAFVAGRLVERETARRAVYRAQWWSSWQAVRRRAEKLF
jgi:CHAD domain-containing protein